MKQISKTQLLILLFPTDAFPFRELQFSIFKKRDRRPQANFDKNESYNSQTIAQYGI